jgi:hypothetical protein
LDEIAILRTKFKLYKMKKTLFSLFLLIAALFAPITSSFGIIEIQHPNNASTLEGCASITLQTEIVIEAIITSITETEVHYRPCDKPDSAEMVLEKTKIWNIKSEKGDLLFKNPKKLTQSEAEVVKGKHRVENSLAIAGLVFCFLIGPFAFPLSLIALHQINKNPWKYKESSTAFAIAGVVISGLQLLAIIMLLIWIRSFF